MSRPSDVAQLSQDEFTVFVSAIILQRELVWFFDAFHIKDIF